MYQKCPFKTFNGLYNILKVPKTSKVQLQTRPTFTAIALPICSSLSSENWTRLVPVSRAICVIRTLGPLGFECSQHRQTLRPTVDGTRSKALRPYPIRLAPRYSSNFFSSLLLSSLELSDTPVCVRALLGTAPHLREVAALKLYPSKDTEGPHH